MYEEKCGSLLKDKKGTKTQCGESKSEGKKVKNEGKKLGLCKFEICWRGK
jgi:hypothetical protein